MNKSVYQDYNLPCESVNRTAGHQIVSRSAAGVYMGVPSRTAG